MSIPENIPASPSLFRPKFFLVGIVLGLVLLGLLGRRLGSRDFHPDFVRFQSAISPEGNYYPTVDELVAIVRSHCRPDQTLVIVGGNSILLGVWQPVDEVWTKHLQETLGDHYCVLNFAFRGASPSDCGAIVAEVLRKEYPHQIYIADEAPLNGVAAIGSIPYRFMFWQAYFAGRLETFPIRDFRAREDLMSDIGRYSALDIVASNVADSFLHFRNLWNWVGFNIMFTIPSIYGQSVPDELTPRGHFRDEEPDIFDPAMLPRRYDPANLDREMTIIRGMTANAYERQPDGTLALTYPARHEFTRYTSEAFPPDLRPRTIMMIGQNSPFYRRAMTPEEAARDAQAHRESVEIWRAAGYTSFVFGEDFLDDDYGDRIHLSKLGGAKLAAQVAPAVVQLAERLGYNR